MALLSNGNGFHEESKRVNISVISHRLMIICLRIYSDSAYTIRECLYKIEAVRN